MRTRRSSAHEAEPAPPAAKLRKVVKQNGKKKASGARKVVVAPRVIIKSTRLKHQPGDGQMSTRSGGSKARGSQRAEPEVAAAAAAAARATAAAATTGAAAQADTAGRKQRVTRWASAAASAAACQETTISDLSAETLQEIFLKLAQNQQYCRETLPLVCKRFRHLLQQPSPVWEVLQINFLEKGAVLGCGEAGQEEEALDAADLGRRRRLLRTAVERWLKPRAQAVKRLIIMFSSLDPTHTFSTGGRGLRQLFRMLPGLQELRLASCSDIFHGRSFVDLGCLQQLRVLAVTCVTSSVAAEDLAPLEQLKQLKSLTIHCNKQHEEAAGPCFTAFPDVLLKMKGLQELAFTSIGITHIPTGITRLKSLVALDVSGTAISFLPQNLWRCSELRHVRLNGTNVVLGLQHAWDPLVKLPRLETLECRETKTRSLPVGLSGLTALTALDLSDNIFDHCTWQGQDALGCLQHMPALKRLDLQRSQISTVPSVCCHLSALTRLDLSHNFLVDLPDGLFLMRNLKELVVQGNSFPRIPEVLHLMPALEVADLSFCIYLEAATSMQHMALAGFGEIRRIDLRKLLGVWKDSSKKWLRQLNQALADRGRPQEVLLF